MTAYEETGHVGAAGSGFVAAASATVRDFAEMMKRRAEIMRAERMLREMPDHMLKDIGMHRSEIPAMVR